MTEAIAPAEFARRCREIAASKHGHEAHQALDALCDQTLASLGYSEGLEIFRAASAAVHASDGSYAYWARGERNGLAKLDPDKVREIRRSGERPGALAERYGVSEQTISYVRQRRTWKHVA